MKLFAVGQEAVGIVAVGHSATGVLADRPSRRRLLVATALTAALAGLWWVAAGQWLVHDLTRPAEIPVEAPEPPLPCVPLC